VQTVLNVLGPARPRMFILTFQHPNDYQVSVRDSVLTLFLDFVVNFIQLEFFGDAISFQKWILSRF
jgi:hypothetical protein